MGLILCVLLVEQAGGAEVWSVVPTKSPLDELDTAPSSRWGSDPVVLFLHAEQTGGEKKQGNGTEREIKQGKSSLLGQEVAATLINMGTTLKSLCWAQQMLGHAHRYQRSSRQ